MRENPDRHVHPLPPTAYRKARICLRLRHLKSVVKSQSIPPARLKLVFPAGDQVDYEVPASVVHRGPTTHGIAANLKGKSLRLELAGEFRATVISLHRS